MFAERYYPRRFFPARYYPAVGAVAAVHDVVVADGSLTEPLANLRVMLSQCATFQELMDVANAGNARARIYQQGLAGAAERPFAFIRLDSDQEDADSGGTRTYYLGSGILQIGLEMSLAQAGEVTAESALNIFTDSDLAGLPDDFFNGRQLTMTSGAAQGESAEVADFNGSTGQITIETDLSVLPGVGSAFDIASATVDAAEMNFLKYAGKIKDELLAQSGASGNLNLRRVSISDYGRGALAEEEQDYAGAMIECEYGV